MLDSTIENRVLSLLNQLETIASGNERVKHEPSAESHTSADGELAATTEQLNCCCSQTTLDPAR